MTLSSGQKPLFYSIFLLSGFCALVYEILWTKHLSLTFGTTILAVSIVTATFMGGLAIGSYLLGRYADRDVNLLKIYAILEVGIALSAILFVPTLGVVEWIYVYLLQAFPGWPGLLSGLNFFFSAMLLVPPTIFMGGTFPIICRYCAREKSGGHIGRLYALNTLGATLGAFTAGYVFIPSLGMALTGYFAVALNLVIAAVSYKLSNNSSQSLKNPPAKRFFQPEAHKKVLLSVSIIGFLSLAYEILWTRVFLLFLGNTSFAFSMMLSAYLIGISLGGVLYARLAHPQMEEKKIFVLLTTLMGVVVLVTVPFYDQLSKVFMLAHEISGDNWWLLTLLSFLIVFATMFVPTVLSGALLPAAVAILDPGKAHVGEGVGLVVLHNTVGAVFGSLVAGFVLLPSLGVLEGFRFLAIMNVLLALFLTISFCRQKIVCRLVYSLVGLGLVLVFIPVSWNQKLMNCGVYCYASKYLKMGGLDEVLKTEKIIEVIEGIDTTVAIHESEDGRSRFFTVNGKTDGGTGSDLSTQTLVGQLPMLLHQNPQDVLVIGLGTGITLRGMSAHPTRGIDCVEISSEVVEASRHFTEFNGDVLNDPKVKLFVRDGRNMLLSRPKQYDVIVSEPSNPWQSGNSNLFTDDFYRLAFKRLKSDGLFCQWIGLYDITSENLQTLIRTFLKTFPKVMTFKSGSDMVLVGASKELVLDYQQLRRRFANPQIAQVMRRIGVDNAGELVAGHYLFSEESLKLFSGEGILNTDDHSLLEYSARYNLGETTLGEHQKNNVSALLKAQGKVLIPLVNLGKSKQQVAMVLRELAIGYQKYGRNAEAEHFMRKAASL